MPPAQPPIALGLLKRALGLLKGALALLKGALGLLEGIEDYAFEHHIGLLAAAPALTGVRMLFIGLLADLIDQRMKL